MSVPLSLRFRSTSAGYRLPVSKSRPKSAVQERPSPAKATAATSTGQVKTHSDAEIAKSDAVTQDKIWRQRVDTETKGVRSWERDWGFLTEFDPKGRPITPKELPEEVNMFSESVPNTNSGNYGSRLGTDIGQTMQDLEFKFNSGNRKKKLGNDLICY